MQQPIKPGFGFGEFSLDVSERRLLRAGVEVPLSPKVFDTLVLLVENAGHLIEKDEFMRRLWPGTFVGEDALARNISILRRCLREGGDSQTLIETVPTRGYRFVAAVRQITLVKRLETKDKFATTPADSPELAPAETPRLAPGGTASKPIGEGSPGVSRSWLRRTAFVMITLAVGSLAGLVTFWLLAPVPGPRVRRMTQITHSGRCDPGWQMTSDGSRIYFLERDGDHWNLMQTSVSGGDAQVVDAPFRNTFVMDVSPDRSNLLIGSFSRGGERMPLWIWPVQGGAPKRLGEVTAYHAAWSPTGRQILFSGDDGIYQIDADGTNERKFAATGGQPGTPRWSPDNRRLRFGMQDPQAEAGALWEINSDGTNLHRLLPGWDKLPQEWEGAWTPDGRYFLFPAKHAGSSMQEMWAIREVKNLFRQLAAQPIQLTAGPIEFGELLPARDDHKVFALGINWQTELARYDLASHEFRPFAPDVHTGYMSYSRDGAWIAYVRTAGNSVVAKVKSDGTQPVDLTPPAIHAWDPRWSPDGKQISFSGLTENGMAKIFLVSAEGGIPKVMFPDSRQWDGEASWSPDGKLLAFHAFSGWSSPPGQSSSVIQVLNLSTNQLSVLPGSRDLHAPTWSPDGRFLAAASEDDHKLMLLDLRSQKWTRLAEATSLHGGGFAWSQDSKFVYFQDFLAPNQPVHRIRLSDRKQELVTSFESFLRGGVQRVGAVTLAPDGSLIVGLNRNSADLYALELDLP